MTNGNGIGVFIDPTVKIFMEGECEEEEEDNICGGGGENVD
jgi:hypothetical protein